MATYLLLRFLFMNIPFLFSILFFVLPWIPTSTLQVWTLCTLVLFLLLPPADCLDRYLPTFPVRRFRLAAVWVPSPPARPESCPFTPPALCAVPRRCTAAGDTAPSPADGTNLPARAHGTPLPGSGGFPPAPETCHTHVSTQRPAHPWALPCSGLRRMGLPGAVADRSWCTGAPPFSRGQAAKRGTPRSSACLKATQLFSKACHVPSTPVVCACSGSLTPLPPHGTQLVRHQIYYLLVVLICIFLRLQCR